MMLSSSNSTKKSKAAVTNNASGFIGFPLKLHIMLSRIDTSSNSNSIRDRDDGSDSYPIAGWNENGTCFKVHNREEFATNFRHGSFKSFQRQLSIYNFSRVKDGPDKGYYYHPDFQRDDIHRCNRITRGNKKQKSPPTTITTTTTLATSTTTTTTKKRKNDDFDFDTLWDTTTIGSSNQDEVEQQQQTGFPSSLWGHQQQGVTTTLSGLPYGIYESNSDTILWMMQAGYSTRDLASMLDVLPSSSSSASAAASGPTVAAAASPTNPIANKTNVSDFACEILGLFNNSNINNKKQAKVATQQQQQHQQEGGTMISLDSLSTLIRPSGLPSHNNLLSIKSSNLHDIVNDDPVSIDEQHVSGDGGGGGGGV